MMPQMCYNVLFMQTIGGGYTQKKYCDLFIEDPLECVSFFLQTMNIVINYS